MTAVGCRQDKDVKVSDQEAALAVQQKSSEQGINTEQTELSFDASSVVDSSSLITTKKDSLDTSITTKVATEDQASKASKAVAKPANIVNKSKEPKITKAEKAPSPKEQPAQITFQELTYDFGEITEGDVIQHEFKFMNTSKSPLEIVSATATCGCTRPTFPFITIEPGGTHQISVSFHSVGKSGPQNPEITITANTNPKQTILKLTGTVIPKEKKGGSAKDSIKDSPIKAEPKGNTDGKEIPSSIKKTQPEKILKDASTKISIKQDSIK